MPKANKTLKQKLEDNIVIALIVAGVAVGTTTAGVMSFLNTQENKNT